MNAVFRLDQEVQIRLIAATMMRCHACGNSSNNGPNPPHFNMLPRPPAD